MTFGCGLPSIKMLYRRVKNHFRKKDLAPIMVISAPIIPDGVVNYHHRYHLGINDPIPEWMLAGVPFPAVVRLSMELEPLMPEDQVLSHNLTAGAALATVTYFEFDNLDGFEDDSF